MEKHKADKLDLFFQEKLQNHEISPEEDYWPYLEKGLDKAAFYKFGWKHINIYNVSLGVLAILTALLFSLLKTPEQETQQPQGIPPANAPILKDTISGHHNFVAPKEKTPVLIHEGTTGAKNNTKKNTSATTPSAKPTDSLPAVAIPKEELISAPPREEEIKKTEEKPKPKKIIYVVQQDTIIEKDTVKVRRKKKN